MHPQSPAPRYRGAGRGRDAPFSDQRSLALHTLAPVLHPGSDGRSGAHRQGTVYTASGIKCPILLPPGLVMLLLRPRLVLPPTITASLPTTFTVPASLAPSVVLTICPPWRTSICCPFTSTSPTGPVLPGFAREPILPRLSTKIDGAATRIGPAPTAANVFVLILLWLTSWLSVDSVIVMLSL